jgi:hypothetical protein
MHPQVGHMQNTFEYKDNASRWKYIGVWFFASISGKIISHLILSLANAFATSQNYQAITLLATAASSIAVFYIFILIYKYFTELNKTRVLPWIWISSFISALITFAELSDYINNAPFLVTVLCTSPFMIAFAFHYYFKDDNERFEVVTTRPVSNQTYSPTLRIEEILKKEANLSTRDFNAAAKIFPTIRENLNATSLYGAEVRQAYIESILREKAFSKSKEIASNLINKYLEETFGTNEEVIAYAKYLFQKQDNKRLKELVEYIRIIGNDFDISLIKDKQTSLEVDSRKDLLNSIDFIFWTEQDYGICFKDSSVTAFTNSGKIYFIDMSDYLLFSQDYSRISVSENMIDKNAAVNRLTFS